MKRAELATLLRETADAVASGDSAEGRVQWAIGATRDDVVVDAAIRTGNLEGQGGYIMVDESPPAAPPPDPHVDPERLAPGERATGIYVRARDASGWGTYDIAQLTRESLMTWLRSDDRLAERVVAMLLGHEREP